MKQFEEISISRAPRPGKFYPDIISAGSCFEPRDRSYVDKFEADLKANGWTISAEVRVAERHLRVWRRAQ
jgi:hypothetical protein